MLSHSNGEGGETAKSRNFCVLFKKSERFLEAYSNLEKA